MPGVHRSGKRVIANHYFIILIQNLGKWFVKKDFFELREIFGSSSKFFLGVERTSFEEVLKSLYARLFDWL